MGSAREQAMGPAKESGPWDWPKRVGHVASQIQWAMGPAKESGPWGQPKRAGHGAGQREQAVRPCTNKFWVSIFPGVHVTSPGREKYMLTFLC